MQNINGVIKINNANDFILPNVKCSVGIPSASAVQKDTSQIKIHSKKNDPNSAPEDSAPKPVKVTLSDCMSCTGCVTSSEELFQAQDINEFKKGLESEAQFKVVTLSPQSISSIAVKRGLSPQVVAAAIASYLKSIGIHYVLDSSFARELTQQRIYDDFVRPDRTGPLITGVCPGVVAFAEKNEPKTLMPQLSVTRSPMLISGALVKDYLAQSLGTVPSAIFHACVMPCFDKKLEAFRADAKLADGTQLVDCVVTSAEFESFIPADLTPYIIQPTTVTPFDWTSALEHAYLQGSSGDSTSGSYAEYIVSRMERDLPNAIVERKKIYEGVEFHITQAGADLDKRIVILNGYRNFQRVVNQLKTGKTKYDFVELMACPGGCANGAGQVRSDKPHENKKILDEVTAAYRTIAPDEIIRDSFAHVLNQWSEVNPNYEKLIYAKYEAARVNELIEAANAW
uniref:Fe_hyd_lg_C domain-containing protein n=1 Tax=Panagrellus redivivus TaxID=6233 RepID=A0A7E4ZWU4_PANRE